jgi:agmatine/peptidylarginine deiminase
MKAILFLTLLAVPLASLAEMSVCGTEELLPIGFTEEELTRLDEIGLNTIATAPPPAGVRNPGEFEQATGIFVRWPLGVPYDFLVHVSNNTFLWVIVSSSQQAAASSALASAGVNMANTDFLIAPTNTIWVRDYGPWFIMLADGTQGIFNYTYNRPRPNDNNIPVVVGSAWGIPVYTSEIVHTGGNYMSSGIDQSMSTTMVYEENGGNISWVNGQMDDYLGVTNYFTMDDPQGSYIDHIDCWAKVLSPTRVMILSVPPGHPDYASLEAAADLFAAADNPYGTKWDVYRVFSSGTEGYTNGLLHNDTFYLPVWNTSNDSPAAASYQSALPGYVIETVYYSGFSNTDALHCRTRNVMDPYLLWIDHVPVDTVQSTGPVSIDALIRCHPDYSLTSNELFYRTGSSGSFTQITMSPTGADSFHADIPGMPGGTDIQYYLHATDNSGGTAAHPQYAPDTWFNEYAVTTTGIEGGLIPGPENWVSSPSPNPFSASVSLTISLHETSPVSMAVWDISGRLIERIDPCELDPGEHTLSWAPGQDIPDGIYIIRLTIRNSVASMRIVRSAR